MQKSRIVFLALPLFMALSLFAQQQQQQPPDLSKVQVKVQKLSENVYVLQSQGANAGMGNIGAFVGDDGIVLVDAQLVELGPKIEAALKTISDKPVKYVLNTHWHGDHTGGNAYFGKSAIIIAQDNVRKKMETETDRRITNLPLSLPVITFSDQLTLHLNGGELHAIHFAHGHTDGDSLVLFSQTNVVHMGDLFTNFDPPHFPAVDTENDGSGGPQGEIAAAEYVLAKAPDDAKIIPGHGNVASKVELNKYLDVLKGTSAAVQAGMDQGKSLEQLKQEKVLAKWEYLDSPPIKSDVYLERLYKGLASQKAGGAKSGGAQ
jgi:glyoxylase-like metal-dependent hydrolase (beta-lactamase superfamily II)